MEPNSAKLQRNRASCFLQLRQLEKVRQASQGSKCVVQWLEWVVHVTRLFVYVASHNVKFSCHIFTVYVSDLCMYKNSYQAKEAIKEAERCDPDSIFTQFSVYKIAVQENNVQKGIYKALVVW